MLQWRLRRFSDSLCLAGHEWPSFYFFVYYSMYYDFIHEITLVARGTGLISQPAGAILSGSMPSPNLSHELESCLNAAFRRAREARQELLTVEHLLLAILDTPKVREILGACRCDVPQLRQDLKDYLDQSTPHLVAGAESASQPTHGFQRVLQRAVFHVKTSGKKEVDVGSVLVAVFSEKQSHAVFLLQRQKVTRLEVCNYVAHSLTRPVLTIGSIVAGSSPGSVTPAMPQRIVNPDPGDRACVVVREPYRAVTDAE